MPSYMFVWDFIALDERRDQRLGADSARLAQIIEDYDAGLGELLAALTDKQPARQHQHPLHARPRQGRHATSRSSLGDRTGGVDGRRAAGRAW